MRGQPLRPGETFSYCREIRPEDIVAFAELSGDHGAHHGAAARGKPIAHGLLTASVATKIGGDLDFLSREMHVSFIRPVFAGDCIKATVLILAAAAPREDRQRVKMTIRCENQDEDVVLTGWALGYVPIPEDQESPDVA